MILAKINLDNIVTDTIVAELTDNLPEGTWVECPEWVGIGMDINTPEPELVQPTTTGTQTL